MKICKIAGRYDQCKQCDHSEPHDDEQNDECKELTCSIEVVGTVESGPCVKYIDHEKIREAFETLRDAINATTEMEDVRTEKDILKQARNMRQLQNIAVFLKIIK